MTLIFTVPIHQMRKEIRWMAWITHGHGLVSERTKIQAGPLPVSVGFGAFSHISQGSIYTLVMAAVLSPCEQAQWDVKEFLFVCMFRLRIIKTCFTKAFVSLFKLTNEYKILLRKLFVYFEILFVLFCTWKSLADGYCTNESYRYIHCYSWYSWTDY